MISVCILAKNSSSTLRNALHSVQSFPEVIVLDNGSTDSTISIAREYPNVSVYEAPFTGFGSLRNQAASFASHDWILMLDTDETLSPNLLAEIHSLSLDPQTVYSMPRHNYYNNKHITGCGWYPDRVARLYHRKTTLYSGAEVHESIIIKNLQTHLLKNPLCHTPFRSTAEFLAKMQNYSTLFASQYAGKRRSSLIKAVLHSCFTFFRCYFLQRGIFLGAEGLIISLYNSNTVFYKYSKLWEVNKRK